MNDRLGDATDRLGVNPRLGAATDRLGVTVVRFGAAIDLLGVNVRFGEAVTDRFIGVDTVPDRVLTALLGMELRPIAGAAVVRTLGVRVMPLPRTPVPDPVSTPVPEPVRTPAPEPVSTPVPEPVRILSVLITRAVGMLPRVRPASELLFIAELSASLRLHRRFVGESVLVNVPWLRALRFDMLPAGSWDPARKSSPWWDPLWPMPLWDPPWWSSP